MFRNPYTQVALTYVRRPFSSSQACIRTAVVVGAGIWFIRGIWQSPVPINRDHFVTMPLILIALAAGFLAMHVKEQFAESRSHVMPGFRRVHIVVATLATLILAVLASAIFTWHMGLQSLALIAITVFTCGVMFWLVLVLSNWTWPIILLILLNSSEFAKDSMESIVSGHFETQAVGLLALGVALIVLAGIRLSRLNEDMPEYHRRMPTTRWETQDRVASRNTNYDGLWPRMLVDRYRKQVMEHLTRHVKNAARSPWSRVCRWQVGMPTNWWVWLWGLLPLGMLQVLSWYLPHRTSGTIQSDRMADMMTSMMVANSFAFFPMILILPQLAGWLTTRTRTLGHEVMLPVDRQTYVRQLCMAVAVSYFQLCGVVLAGTLFWYLVVVATPPPLGFLASVVAAALLIQISQFGVVVFALTITRQKIMHIVAMVVAMSGPMVLIMGGTRMGNLQMLPEVLPIAAGLAVLGVLLAYIAYRRWLVADFD